MSHRMAMQSRVSMKGCMASLITLAVLHTFTNLGLWAMLADRRIRKRFTSFHANIIVRKKPARASTLYPANYDTGFLLHDKDSCSEVRDISLLYVVNSAPGHFKQRQILRTTFADGLFFLPQVVKTIFLIGRSSNTSIGNEIISEFAEHKDIVQGDFVDSYRNLTLKLTMAFKWMSMYCRNVKLVGKIDDDTFVNTYKLLDMERDLKGRGRVHCDIATGSVGKIQRGHSKWAVHVDVFKFYRYFPWTYCGGYAVFVPGSLVPNFYKASLISPFLWIDDVYLTGIVASRLNIVDHHQGAFMRRDFKMQPKKGLECFRKPDCPVLATTVASEYIPEFWRLVQEAWKVK
ncbi:lactosylceramide 1,3-N-acetyl-beta-D-glucosaminyltransferase A-like [Haliotis rubra]|uniref:lactosylceramide 1,3-N-acetyl-beta-D-glucosaminyltransferase A-like n=1 Tax=Haliotis rubra TaxID=36100 RepID=UPI001EE58F61|nr:lactosylceramide 1,3-N-acetyl-beta-D-glucosaminyltransferase A-like [Haliotis rubra]